MLNSQVVFFMVIFVGLLGWILRMIFRNQLKEVYAVLWIIAALCIPASILFSPILFRISEQIGFVAPANFTFVVAILVVVVLLLHFSSLNSKMQRTLKNVIQQLAILDEEFKEFREEKRIGKKEEQV